MGWRAVTRSGTVYESRGSGIYAAGTYFHSWTLRVFDTPEERMNWETLRELPSVDRPEVGKHIYLSSFGDAGWRISTPVVSVEEVDDE